VRAKKVTRFWSRWASLLATSLPATVLAIALNFVVGIILG
jgi:uncharacterized membrane protein